MTISSSSIKGLTGSNKENPILKKAIRIGDEKPPTMVVILHKTIVEQLDIDEQCWFEQIPTGGEGILLKIVKAV